LLKPPLDWVNQSYDLRVHELTLSFSNLPKSFDGLRVLQLSDNHYGEIMSPAWHEHVCREAMALRPDLIALTGDLVAGDHLYRQAVESMKSLRAPLGVYVVRGNHDFYTEPHIIAYWLESQGFNLMSNRHTDLERDGQILRICGVEHPYVPIKSFQGALGPEPRNDRPFRLVLAHSPDVATRLERLGADLFLTGHTHGGQWRLPVIGPVIYPSIHGRRFDKGIQKLGDALLHNSSGFGLHTIPLRLNCPPEITLFTLRRGNEKDTESLAYNIQT
jgi:predicted MPP superfamily phosphohydrolase